MKHGSSITQTPGSCVWSECYMGYTNSGNDDQYGDGRDGDENWYQYRTQSFCANTAYALYGRKKSDYNPFGFIGCSRRHFINSFFTYGGADNMLKSVGKDPALYYDASDYYQNNDNNENGDDDASSYIEPNNAICVPYYGTLQNDQEQQDEYGNYNNERRDRDRERDRNLGSQDNNNNADYSSSLGCNSDGNYIMGAFKGGSCDGNYFLQSIDKFSSYNRQHKHVGCHSLWHRGANEVTYERMATLLQQSWTCDIRLYPRSCPDPYGIKGHYEYALRTAAHGGNPMRAYRNSVWRRPIRTLSWIVFVITLIVLLITYNIKHHTRIMDRGGGWKVGLLCLKEDFSVRWGNAQAASAVYWAKAREAAAKRSADRRLAAQQRRAERVEEGGRKGRSPRSSGDEKQRRRRKSKSGKSRSTKSKSRSKTRRDTDDDVNDNVGSDEYGGGDGGGGAGEEGVEMSRVSPRKSKSSKRSPRSGGDHSGERGGGERSEQRRSSRRREQQSFEDDDNVDDEQVHRSSSRRKSKSKSKSKSKRLSGKSRDQQQDEYGEGDDAQYGVMA